ncbi:SGNH/GDSL hydrolase family protein [Sciscionella marina]|uniref:SGNH/GDSL hydrolase family protein n=1 Tax=Sciscionella marina TaxID=508770 RepID=UPI00037F75C9|nr:SGNH/GDSL hydrolase family protein [Sciscionella marina]
MVSLGIVVDVYASYVAIGDSQTEGLHDGDDKAGFRGWADRLAGHLAAVNPGLRYANLAVRGKKVGEVHAEQLGPALVMRPELATVVAGLNDIIRPGYDGPAVIGHLEEMIGSLSSAGTKVATLTYPDVGVIMPIARRLQPRIEWFNAQIREIAGRNGATVVETDRYPVCTDLRIWSLDRLHLNTLGHTLLAAGFAHGLQVPGSDENWTRPLPPRRVPSLPVAVAREARWAVEFLAPWVARRIRGRSSGDGRTAKRPELSPVSAQPADVSAEGPAE